MKRVLIIRAIAVLLMLPTIMSGTSCRSSRTQKESSKSTYDSTRTSSRAWEKVTTSGRSATEQKDIQAAGRIRLEFRYDTGAMVIEESALATSAGTVDKVLSRLINNRLQLVTIDADGTIIDKSNIQINEQENINSTGQKSEHTDISKIEEQSKKVRQTKGVPVAVSLGWGIAIIAALGGVVLIRIYVPNLFNRKKNSV